MNVNLCAVADHVVYFLNLEFTISGFCCEKYPIISANNLKGIKICIVQSFISAQLRNHYLKTHLFFSNNLNIRINRSKHV